MAHRGWILIGVGIAACGSGQPSAPAEAGAPDAGLTAVRQGVVEFDAERCPVSRWRVGQALGSTSLQVEGRSAGACHFLLRREIENTHSVERCRVTRGQVVIDASGSMYAKTSFDSVTDCWFAGGGNGFLASTVPVPVPVPALVEEGSIVVGQRQGEWKAYLPRDGGRRLVRVLDYSDGHADGHFVGYDVEGQLWAEGRFRRSVKHGPWIEPYRMDDKHHFEGEYVDGRKQGAWLAYDAVGRVIESTTYRDGLQSGPHTVWSGAGRRIEEGAFVDDLRDGVWRRLRDDGTVVEELVWDRGKIVRTGTTPRHPPKRP